MTVDDLTPQEIAAALAARRELGPDYEHEIAASLAEKMERRIDAEVAARTGGAPGAGADAETAGESASAAARQHQLAMTDAMTARVTAVASLVGGTIVTIAASDPNEQHGVVPMAWIGIIVINLAVNLGRRRRRNRP
jgi:hypothetical protein